MIRMVRRTIIIMIMVILITMRMIIMIMLLRIRITMIIMSIMKITQIHTDDFKNSMKTLLLVSILASSSL